MGAKPQPCYNRIRAINDRVIMRLQYVQDDYDSILGVVFEMILIQSLVLFWDYLKFNPSCCFELIPIRSLVFFWDDPNLILSGFWDDPNSILGFVLSINRCLLFTACSSGSFGLNCANQCQCKNSAECDAVTGECFCAPGWVGSACDIRK